MTKKKTYRNCARSNTAKIVAFLTSHYFRYRNTFHSLYAEVPSIRNYEVCDNVDLPTILKDYESYYNIRFQKYPKISKALIGDGDGNVGVSRTVTKCKHRPLGTNVQLIKYLMQLGILYVYFFIASTQEQKSINTTKSIDAKERENKTSFEKLSAITVTPLIKDKTDETKEESQEKILKPLAGLGNQNPEWIAMAETITKVMSLVRAKASEKFNLNIIIFRIL